MHLLASDYPAYGLVQNYGVQAVPQYFLIAGNGTIAQKPYSHQPDDIRKRLLELAR